MNRGRCSEKFRLFFSKYFPWLQKELPLKPAEEAALILRLAKDGLDIMDDNLNSRNKTCYRLRKKYQILYRTAAWAILIVHIFERPIWTYRRSDSSWKNNNIYPSYNLSYMPLYASSLLSLLFLSFLWFAMGLEYGYKRKSSTWYLTVIFIMILVINTVSSIMALCYSIINTGPLFNTNPLASFFIVLIERKFESYVGYFLRTIPKFVVLMLVVALMVCTYTSLGFQIFNPAEDEAKLWFNFYGSAVWNMLMVLNGSNWPVPMIPAYNKNRLFCLYFFAYIIIADWGLLNLVLGFIYMFFRKEQIDITMKQRDIDKVSHDRAFTLLDLEKKGYLTYNQVDELIEEVYLSYTEVTKPSTQEERSQLILFLDKDSLGTILKEDFEHINERCFEGSLKTLRARNKRFLRAVNVRANFDSRRNSKVSMKSTANINSNLLNKPLIDEGSGRSGSALSQDVSDISDVASRKSDERFERTLSEAFAYSKFDNPLLLEHLRASEAGRREEGRGPIVAWTISYLWAKIGIFIDSIYFDISIDTILVITAICCFSGTGCTNPYIAYLVFSCIDAFLKLLVKGVYRYYKSNRNFFDGLITMSLLCIIIADSSLDLKICKNVAVQCLILVRTLLYPRNIFVTEYFANLRRSYRLAFSFAFKGAGHFSFLLLLAVSMLYLFASFGQQLFGGTIIKTGATGESISHSFYGESGYWPVNFNDMPSGLVTMFILLMVNNMHVTTSGFVASNSQWAEVFFACWYALGVLLILNVITAVFINQFVGYLEALQIQKLKRQEQNEGKENGGDNHALIIAEASRLTSTAIATSNNEERSVSSLLDQLSSKTAMTSTGSFNKSIFANTRKRLMLSQWIQSNKPSNDQESSSRRVNASVSESVDSRAPAGAVEYYQAGTGAGAGVGPGVASSVDTLVAAASEGKAPHRAHSRALSSSSGHTTTSAKLATSRRPSLMDPSASQSKKFNSMLDWMYSDRSLAAQEKAAVLVQFARNGEEYSIFSSRRSLVCYRLHSKFVFFFKAAAVLLSLLRIFERPLWTFKHENWNDDAVFPKSGVPLISVQLAIAIKFPLLLILIAGFLLEIGYKESLDWRMFQDFTITRATRFFLTLHTVSSLLVLVVVIASSFQSPQLVTIASAGSILYVLWFNRRSFQKLQILLRIVPRLSIALFVFLVVVLIFAGLGPLIFSLKKTQNPEDDDAAAQYFQTFSDSVWSVFVAITSSDYPNQIMPAYRKYREVCIYFIAFITVGSFGLLHLIVVVVLVEFQKSSQTTIDIHRAARQILLFRAFSILDENNHGFVQPSMISLLFDELKENFGDSYWSSLPEGPMRNIMLSILDVNGDGKITVDDFVFLLDVVKIKLQKQVKRTFVDVYFPVIASNETYLRMKKIESKGYISIAVDCLCTVLLVSSLVVNRNHLFRPTKSSVLVAVLIMLIYVLELILKLVLSGFKEYSQSFRNRLDCTVTVILFFCVLIDGARGDLYKVTGITYILRCTLMFRLIMLPRNIRLIAPSEKNLRNLARLLRRIFAKILTLGIVFLCSGYTFAVLGLFLYGGLISRDNEDPDFLNSPYVKNGFWGLNFNDFTSATITLFCCLKVSDFDVITSGFTSTTSDVTRLYFTAWYVIGVLLLLNVLKSFFLGEFLGLFITHRDMPSVMVAGDQVDVTNEKALDGKGFDSADVRNPLTNAADPESSPSMSIKSSFMLSAQEIPHFSDNIRIEKDSKPEEEDDEDDDDDDDDDDDNGIESHLSQQPYYLQDYVKYRASTGGVKNLDRKELMMLKQRIQQLSLGYSPSLR